MAGTPKHCTEWSEPVPTMKKRREKGVDSHGAVWRLEPENLAAIEVAKALGPPDPLLTAVYAELSALLGKQVDVSEMKAIFAKLGAPEMEFFEEYVFCRFKPQGIQLVFVKGSAHLIRIYLYSEGYHTPDGTYSQFKGELPYGLSFRSTPGEVEPILGRTYSFQGGTAVYHPSKGLKMSIDYKNWTGPVDELAVIDPNEDEVTTDRVAAGFWDAIKTP